MTLREKYSNLRDAAKADANGVRNRRKFHGGYWEKGCAINGALLTEDINTASTLGYETHLQVVDGKITIYYVAKMPTVPTAVYCA